MRRSPTAPSSGSLRPHTQPTTSPGLRVSAMLVLIGMVFAALPSGGAAVGAALYPDLRTSLPSGLYFERGGDAHYRLRFDNTVGNYGGRLEVAVDGNRHIYQNVYDQHVGGSRVVRQKVASDLIFHPEHNHFHFKDFARYELLRKDSAGAYRTTSRSGSKTTFCILDFVRITSSGATNPQYNTCGSTVQGLSAGWGDTYYASLAGQWIDVGTSMLSDGAYALRSTADPYNRLLETNDGNNVGTTYFTVRNGALSVSGTPPLCSVTPDRGRVGTTVQLNCSRLGNGETVDVYWGSTASTPRKSVTSTSTGAISTSVAIPDSDLGNHYVIAKGRSSGKQAAALFNTLPSVALTQSSGIVGTSAPVTLRGFSAGETIEIRYYKYSASSQGTVVATAVASSSGSSSSTLTVPASPYGSHRVEAVGTSSGAVASTTFAVTPGISLAPTSAPAGSVVGVSLRGFVAGETRPHHVRRGRQVAHVRDH